MYSGAQGGSPPSLPAAGCPGAPTPPPVCLRACCCAPTPPPVCLRACCCAPLPAIVGARESAPLQVCCLLAYWLSRHFASTDAPRRPEVLAAAEWLFGLVATEAGAGVVTGRPDAGLYARHAPVRRAVDSALEALRRWVGDCVGEAK